MKIIVMIVAVWLALAESSQAYVVNGSMGRDPGSSLGQCLSVRKPSIEDARVILRKHEIKVTDNATDEELIAVATGIKQISHNHGGVFKGVTGARFRFTDDDGVWNQSSGPIIVNREFSTETGMRSHNIGMLMHELGHYVGNNWRHRSSTYEEYYEAVPQACHFTWYSQESRREEFADVFAAFVMNPSLLLAEGEEACADAHRFFRKRVFVTGKLAHCEDRPAAPEPEESIWDFWR